MKHRATCACGQLQVSVDGELTRASLCHCHQCQKRTGSAFGYQVRVARSEVTVSGRSTAYERKAEGVVTLHFCPVCGSTVYWTLDGLPDDVVIAAGAFAGVSTPPPPTFSVYEARMHPWVILPDSVTTHWE
ncbi:MAG: GFA family protein [Myxococcota bacterium]